MSTFLTEQNNNDIVLEAYQSLKELHAHQSAKLEQIENEVEEYSLVEDRKHMQKIRNNVIGIVIGAIFINFILSNNADKIVKSINSSTAVSDSTNVSNSTSNLSRESFVYGVNIVYFVISLAALYSLLNDYPNSIDFKKKHFRKKKLSSSGLEKYLPALSVFQATQKFHEEFTDAFLSKLQPTLADDLLNMLNEYLKNHPIASSDQLAVESYNTVVELKKNYPWFQLSLVSLDIIKAFKNIGSIFHKAFSGKIRITDTLINDLKYSIICLAVYEYLFAYGPENPDIKLSHDREIVSNHAIETFASTVNGIDIDRLPKLSIFDSYYLAPAKEGLRKVWKEKLQPFLASKNLYKRVISWYLLIFIGVLFFSRVVCYLLNIEFDGKILAAVFAAAGFFTPIFYNSQMENKV